eukprot:jgi/Ulvmu1/6791/UM030_0129.1
MAPQPNCFSGLAPVVISAIIGLIATPGTAIAQGPEVYNITQAQGPEFYNITRPLRICTASIQDFGARCNGSPTAEFEHEEVPYGPVPSGGWCASGEDFCGYDIDVWRLCSLPCLFGRRHSPIWAFSHDVLRTVLLVSLARFD